MWNLLQDELGGGVWPRLFVALLDTGAKGLILMAAAGLAAAALRRKAAAARHLVWMLALCGLLLLPLVSLMMPKWTLPILPAIETPVIEQKVVMPPLVTEPARPEAASPPVSAPAPAPQAATSTAQPQTPSSAPMAAIPPKPATPINYTAWLLATWLAVALMSLAPFAAGVVAVARMRRRAETFSEGDLQTLAVTLGQSIGLKRPARLLRGPTGSMPMATGFIKPAVFLPADALAWTEEKRRVVLLHELAHVKRRDCLAHAVARTAVSLHWFNLLAWLALRQLRIEREHACDDLVLASGERPSAYAENLLEIARTLRASTVVSAAAITMAQKSQLEGRLLAVLDAARNRGLVTRKFAVICIAAVGMVVGVLSAVAVTREIAATGDLLAIAKPVKKTSLEGFFGGWRNLPFKLSDEDEEAIAQCLELSQSYNAIHSRVNRFSLPEVRESLEALLSKHPDFFYVEHFLGTWHQLNGNSAQANDYFLRSYRHAPVVLIQRYEHADGSPITGAAIRNFEIECNRVQGGSLDPSLNLKYFDLTTDSEGCVYLPVYDTVYRVSTRSFLEGIDVNYPALGWFESRGKVAMLPVAAAKNFANVPSTANANSDSAIPDFLKGSWAAEAKEVQIAGKALSLPLTLKFAVDGTISGHLGDVPISDAKVAVWTAQNSREYHQDFDHKIEGHLKGILDGTPYDGPVLIGLIDQNDHWLARPFIMDPSGGSQKMFGLSHYMMEPSQTLRFAGGLAASLVAVGDSHGANPNTFWLPDGTPIGAVPTEFESILSVLHPSKDEVEREFLLRILPQPGGPAATDISARWRILAPSASSSGGQNVRDNAMYVKAAQSISQNLASVDLELGIAAGPWTAVVEAGFAMSSTIGEYSLAVDKPHEQDGELTTTVSHNVPFEKDCRLVAFDQTGVAHPLVSRSTYSADQFTQATYSLESLSPENIQRLELQVRDFEWQTFEEIALNPDTAKAPKISESPEAQNAGAAVPAGPDGAFSAEFAGGYRAHVISVRDAMGGSSGIFWAGDGSPMALGPTASDRGNFTLSPETIGRLFFVELLPPSDSHAMTDVTFMCSIESAGSGAGVSNSGSGASLRSEFFAAFPINTKDASIKVGVAAGPWKTVFSGCIGCNTASESEFNASFSEVFDHEGAKLVTATHKPLEQERRVVAIDATGAAHPLQHTRSVDGEEISQSDWILNTIAPENVKGLEIQIRDYEWRTISGIALYPSEKSAQSNAEQSSAKSSDSPYSVFNNDYLGALLEDPNLLAHIAGDAITPPAANTSWGPVVNSLQAAVRFKTEKPEYVLGEKIGMEFLVRNTGPEPLEFLTSETRNSDKLILLDENGKTGRGGGIRMYTGIGKIRRVKLAPGEVAAIDCVGFAVMPEETKLEPADPIGSYGRSHPGLHEVQFEFHMPETYSSSGEFAPKPGDWTGTLTTGLRSINLIEPEVSDDQVANTPSATESAVREILTEMQDDEEGYLATVSAPQRDQLRALLPDAADFLLALASDEREEVRIDRRKAASIVSDLWTEVPREKLEKFFATAGRTYVRSRPVYPQGVAALIGTGYNFPGCVGLWERGDGLVVKTTTRRSVDGQPDGEPFEYSGAGAGAGWIETKSLSPGTHSAQVFTNYEITHYGLTFTGRLNSEAVTFEIGAPTLPDDLAAPASEELDQQVGRALKISNFESMSFDGDSFYEDQPNVIFLSGPDAGTKLYFPEWKLTEALPVDLCFDVQFKLEDSGEVFAGYPLVQLKNTSAEAYFAPRNTNAFAAGRSGAVPVRILLTPSRAQALTDLTITQYYNGPAIMSEVVEAFVEAPAEKEAEESADAALGPEIEVTVRHAGENCMIDFDTGKLFTPPDFNGTEYAFAWMAKNGIDAGGGNQDEVRGLIGMDLVLNPEANEVWDDAATNGALNHDAFKYGTPGNPVYLSAKGELPATWTFKTREGGRGIVQILGFEDEEPRGVKIRYRMIE